MFEKQSFPFTMNTWMWKVLPFALEQIAGVILLILSNGLLFTACSNKSIRIIYFQKECGGILHSPNHFLFLAGNMGQTRFLMLTLSENPPPI